MNIENQNLETNENQEQEITSIEDIVIDEELVAKVQEQEKKQPLLIVRNLNKYFKKGSTFFKAVNNANFDVYEGDFFGIIGESGSGKSTIGKLLIRLLQSDSGTTIFDNNIISDKKITKKTNRWLTTNMQMIFQDPMSSLNPKKNVLNLIAEPLVIKKSLRDEAVNIIKEHIKINPYFQYTFKQKDFEVSKEFDNYYFPEMIKIYKLQIDKINNYKYDKTLKFDENKFNFLSILLDLDEKSKKVNYSLYKHADDIKNVFTECLKIHENNELDPIEIELFNSRVKVKELKEKLKYSPAYFETKQKLLTLEEELNNHLSDSTEKYRDQIKHYIQGAKESYKKEIKTLQNQLMLTQSFILGLEIRVKIEVKNTACEALDFIKGLELLSLFDAREVINKCEDWAQSLYDPIFDQIKTLKKLKINKDELAKKFITSSEIERSNTKEEFDDLAASVLGEIKNKNFELKNSIDAIENQYNQIIESLNEIDINSILMTTDYFELFKIADYISYQQSLVDVNTTQVYKKQIELTKQELVNLKKQTKEWKQTESYQQAKNNYQKAIEKLNKDKQDCKTLYDKNNVLFNQNVQPKIDEHAAQLKKWVKELAKQKQELKSCVNKKVKEITIVLKELMKSETSDDIDMEVIKSFKNDINIKLRTIDALTFEFNTILEEVTTYRDLRSKSKVAVWSNLKDLIKILMKKKVYEALNSVGLKNEHAYRYPHEFSGGQRQRIVIARALINNPKIIIADEPISALDVSIQAQVINIMKDLAEQKGITFLFVAHDLSMVNYACNRMIIMHNGRILEKGDTQEIFNNPIHPYTLSLLRSAPQLSKIHIDLASGGIDASYGHFNLPSSYYSFHSVSNEKEHFVFGTEEQIKLWSQKTR